MVSGQMAEAEAEMKNCASGSEGSKIEKKPETRDWMASGVFGLFSYKPCRVKFRLSMLSRCTGGSRNAKVKPPRILHYLSMIQQDSSLRSMAVTTQPARRDH